MVLLLSPVPVDSGKAWEVLKASPQVVKGDLDSTTAAAVKPSLASALGEAMPHLQPKFSKPDSLKPKDKASASVARMLLLNPSLFRVKGCSKSRVPLIPLTLTPTFRITKDHTTIDGPLLGLLI